MSAPRGTAVRTTDGRVVKVKVESDPNGLKSNDVGAKLDAGKVEVGLIFNDMPRAVLAVAEVGTYGRHKYTKGGWQHVEDGVERYTNAMDRHRLKEGIETHDTDDSGLLHAAQLAWNALARLELMLREQESNTI